MTSGGSRLFRHAGATLVAEERGSGGTPIVLVHGIGMGRSVFADLVAHLGDSAHTIAIDLPGYGEAPEPPRVLTMERTADLVAAFLRAETSWPVVLVGHSMGAQVVLEVGARHPDVVDRLVLIGPAVDPRERTGWQQLLRLVQDLAVESPRVIFVGAREYIRSGPHMRMKLRAMLVHRPEDILPLVPAPTLVLRGSDDRVARRDWCEFIASTLPDGRTAEVAGHGHEAMIRDAAPAARVISAFLEDD